MSDTTFNGWTNYETWLINIHLDGLIYEFAQDCYKKAEASAIFSKAEEATFELENVLKDYVKEHLDEAKAAANSSANRLASDIVTDLLNAAYSIINFRELAKNAIETVESEAANV